MTILKKARLLFDRKNRNLYTIKEFGHINKDLLIIVCDPKTDRMYAMYKDRFVNAKIKTTSGKQSHVVREVLRHSQFEKNIDGFLGSLMETLQLPIMKANQFYQTIDGFLFAIAKSLRKKRSEKHIVSPFVDSNITK